MSTLLRSAVVAVSLLAGLSAAQARSDLSLDNGATQSAYDLNSTDGARAFWDRIERNSGN